MRSAYLLLLALAAAGAPASAQTAIPAPPKPAQAPAVARTAPAPPKAPTRTFEVKGFRSAAFGMTPTQVRAAIAADFGAAKTTDTANPAEGTTAIQAVLPKLDPGPGPVTLTYIFGATSRRLSNVNVVWSLGGNPAPDERERLVTAAIQLASYFQSQPAPKASRGVTPVGPNSLVMFSAVDAKGAAVEISASGIRYQAGSTAAPPPEPTGPALLRISYVANAANPDIIQIKPGAF